MEDIIQISVVIKEISHQDPKTVKHDDFYDVKMHYEVMEIYKARNDTRVYVKVKIDIRSDLHNNTLDLDLKDIIVYETPSLS